MTGQKMVRLHPTTCHDGMWLGVQVQLYSFLMSALDAGGLLMPCPSYFTSLEWPGIHFVHGWVGPRDALDGCERCRPSWDSISGMSSP